MDAEVQALINAARFTMACIDIYCLIYVGKTFIQAVVKIIDIKNLMDSMDAEQ